MNEMREKNINVKFSKEFKRRVLEAVGGFGNVKIINQLWFVKTLCGLLRLDDKIDWSQDWKDADCRRCRKSIVKKLGIVYR